MSNIKINDVPQRIQYAATNGQTQFAIPFPFFQNNYVYVWQDGVQIFPGASPGQYAITGAGSPSGGLITLVTPAVLDSIITIQGVMPIDRTSIYSPTISNLTGSDLNGDFNREVVMMKQIETTQALLQLQYAPWALVPQDPDDTTYRYIPLPGPLQAWRLNEDGTAIETFLTPSSGGLAPENAEYILQTLNGDLPDAIALDLLPSGFMVNELGVGLSALREITGVTNQTVVANGNGVSGNPAIGIAPNPTIPGTAGIGIPAGTTAERVTPTPPSIGLRFNTDSSVLEAYISGMWQIIPSSASGAFLPLSGGTMSGDIDMDGNELLDAVFGTDTDAGGNLINNVANPLADTDAANKIYVDTTAAGRYFVQPVRVSATTNFASIYDNGVLGVGATLTASVNGAASLDGISLFLNDRVIFPFQTDPTEGGIYTVTNLGSVGTQAIYTRASDYDEPSDIDPGDTVWVTEGNTYAGGAWMETAIVVAIGTDPIDFVLAVNPNVVTLNTTQTITGDKEFTGVVEVPTPTAEPQAVNKGYVDSFVGGGHIGKNIIIGGDFGTNPWQRGTSFVAPATGAFLADRWRISYISTAVATVTKTSDAPTVAQAGVLSTASLLHTVTTADASIAAGDAYYFNYRIEGYDYSRIAQQDFTVSFFVKSNVTGTYCVAFQNAGADRSYVAEYTINVANTLELKTITVPASPSAGTWDYESGMGLMVALPLAVGSTYQTTPNTWQTGNFVGTSNQVNNLATIGNTFQFDLVQIEKGTEATPFEIRSKSEELALCERYLWKTFPQGTPVGSASGVLSGTIGYRVTNAGAGNFSAPVIPQVTMRVAPTVTFYNPIAAGTNWYNQSLGANSGASLSLNTGDRGGSAQNTQLAGDTIGHNIVIHCTLNAEL